MPDHGPVRTGILVKKPEPEPKIRFLNQNRTLNRLKFDFGSGLRSQNREPNRRFTIPTVLGDFGWFGQKKFKFFWLNRNQTETSQNRNRPWTAQNPIQVRFMQTWTVESSIPARNRNRTGPGSGLVVGTILKFLYLVVWDLLEHLSVFLFMFVGTF